MWDYAHRFHTKHVDDGRDTRDCGVEVEFDQSSCASHYDQNLIGGMFDYVEKIQEII